MATERTLPNLWHATAPAAPPRSAERATSDVLRLGVLPGVSAGGLALGSNRRAATASRTVWTRDHGNGAGKMAVSTDYCPPTGQVLDASRCGARSAGAGPCLP